MMRTPDSSFLGWRMVAVAFFVDFIAVGFFFYSYGVFFKAIAIEFGDSRLGVAVGITLTQGVGALLAPFLGRALDRYPLKLIMALGALSMGTGFIALGFSKTALQFYLILGLFIGFGAGAMGQLATSKLVSNWFVLKRGAALGIAATGISVSGVIMPGISAALITYAGWREGFMLYGFITIVFVMPIVLKFVISKPEDAGQLPDGETERSRLPPSKPPLKTREFLNNKNFWILVVVIGLLFCVQSGTLIHMVPLLTDRGYGLFNASLIASATAGFGVLGKLIFGRLVDRWEVRYALWLGIFFSSSWTAHHADHARLRILLFRRVLLRFWYGRGCANARGCGWRCLWTGVVWTGARCDAAADGAHSSDWYTFCRMGLRHNRRLCSGVDYLHHFVSSCSGCGARTFGQYTV